MCTVIMRYLGKNLLRSKYCKAGKRNLTAPACPEATDFSRQLFSIYNVFALHVYALKKEAV